MEHHASSKRAIAYVQSSGTPTPSATDHTPRRFVRSRGRRPRSGAEATRTRAKTAMPAILAAGGRHF